MIVTERRLRIEGRRPTATEDGLNARRPWAARHRRAAAWHQQVKLGAFAAGWPRYLPPGAVQIEIAVYQKLGPLVDDDNSRGMTKAIRDAVAKWFQVDDGPSGPINWAYRWERGPDGVEITVRST